MLELDDIQHILLTRTPAITGRYEFLTFDTAAGGRAWLSELLDLVQSAADATETMDESRRWITLAFTWTGLRALGVPEESLASFPDEFREGMAPRADILGDTGPNHPDNWVGGLAGDDVHAIAILFARDDEQSRTIHRQPRQAARPHRWRPQPVVPRLERDAAVQLRPRSFRVPRQAVATGHGGLGRGTHAGFGRTAEAGRVHPRLSRMRMGRSPICRSPRTLSRNGSFMAYRRLQEHVGRVPRLPTRELRDA